MNTSKALQEKIDRMRKAGHEPSAQILAALDEAKAFEARVEKLRADAEKRLTDRRKEREAAELEKHAKLLAQREATLKAEALAAWRANGGADAEFEKSWPGIKEEMLKQAAIAAPGNRKQKVSVSL